MVLEMSNKVLIICQGIHTSKIVAAILSHMPKYCIIITTYEDISQNITKDINEKIQQSLQYITDNQSFFLELEAIYSLKADLINPYSIIKSLESIDFVDQFNSQYQIIDISSGSIPMNIGLYLYALKNGIQQLSFSFPGERFYKKSNNLSKDEKYKLDIEFARKHTYIIPILPVDIKEVNEHVLASLASHPKKKVKSLRELNDIIGEDHSFQSPMKLSREINKLTSIGLISTSKQKKEKIVSLSESGSTYTRFMNLEPIELKLIWKRRIS